MKKIAFANRDLSWLSFNKQVLMEALDEKIPLRERINFLAIFSSNLDEFYRVRYPLIQLMAQSTSESDEATAVKMKIDREIFSQQAALGKIIRKIKRVLQKNRIDWIYDQRIPDRLQPSVAEFFANQILGKLQLIHPNSSTEKELFAPNSKIFIAVHAKSGESETIFIPIPTPALARFHEFRNGNKTFVLFLEDLIKHELIRYRPELEGSHFYTFKVNRDAEMNLDVGQHSILAKQIKKEVKLRENGNPSRLLYQEGMPEDLQKEIRKVFRLESADMVQGGCYHQLSDLFAFPLASPDSMLWQVTEPCLGDGVYFLEELASRDVLIHPPYHSYSAILRLFNEAAIHPDVREIYLTIYRVAKDSKILQALITAALNGKKVTVFVELKARFDEENNLEWAERMKSVGIRIKYSIPKLKVHAKAALVKFKTKSKIHEIALLGTGNFNESTGKIYTDHFLFTSQKAICKELEKVFKILAKSPERPKKNKKDFDLLWIGKFNLKEQILEKIRRETMEAIAGRRAEIFLKMNNLEEDEVINALYNAAQHGVTIRLLIRGICRLIPGRKGQSEGIIVKRIVDHYLEHGRVFSFFAGGEQEVFLGSADWMNRNLHSRIEICFPILDAKNKSELLTLLEIQWLDNQKAQTFPKSTIPIESKPIRSQVEITTFLAKKSK